MPGSPLNVVAVSNDALRSELLDRLLLDDNSYDAIVVESISRAYSRIRELHPDVVVLFMEIDDVDACQLLSMLHMDCALRGVSVVARTTGPTVSHIACRTFEERSQTLATAAN